MLVVGLITVFEKWWGSRSMWCGSGWLDGVMTSLHVWLDGGMTVGMRGDGETVHPLSYFEEHAAVRGDILL